MASAPTFATRRAAAERGLMAAAVFGESEAELLAAIEPTHISPGLRGMWSNPPHPMNSRARGLMVRALEVRRARPDCCEDLAGFVANAGEVLRLTAEAARAQGLNEDGGGQR